MDDPNFFPRNIEPSVPFDGLSDCGDRQPNLYFFFFGEGFWARALPAADFDVLLVRLSRKTFDAALAAFEEVTFFGAFVCDNALPADVLDLAPVLLFRIVFDALLAALGLVTLDFAIGLVSIFFKKFGIIGQ